MVASVVGLVAGPAQAASTLWVNDDATVGTNTSSCDEPGYNTVQAAANAAAANDTIQVCPGTYTEQVVIDKSLTLIGSGAGTTTIQAPAGLANDPDGAKTLVLFTGAITTAEISGFTIKGPVNGLNFGIYVRDGATANIHDNTVKDIRDEPLSGNQYGYGIEIGKYNNTFPFVNQVGHATITNNNVFGYQKNGIEIEGAGSSGTITGNTVTGAGLIPTTSQNGIQIRRGATGSINSNTVTGNAYTGHEVNATGIVVTYPGNDVVIQDNIVNHNTSNIYTYEAHGVQILNNQVSDAADGRVVAGITADSDFDATASVGITVTITGNTVKNNLSGGSHQGPGIFLWGVNNGTVSGNEIAGSGDDGLLIGSSGNIAITNNLFSGNGFNSFLSSDPNAAAIDFGGVVPELESYGFFLNPLGGFSAHRNSFSGNRNGIWNYDNVSVDAECNWWGDSTGPGLPAGPGAGDGVSTNVDFAPWLGSSDLNGPCEGGTLRGRKQAVRDSLAAKQLTADDKDAKQIEKAIESIDKSLNPDYWDGPNELDPKEGDKVFKEEQKAVEELMKVKDTDVTAEILELVDIDKDLAEQEYNQAPGGKEKDHATDELAKGDADAADSKYDKAIEHYRKAWEHSVKAQS